MKRAGAEARRRLYILRTARSLDPSVRRTSMFHFATLGNGRQAEEEAYYHDDDDGDGG
jgi:hypothetical protein